MHISSMYITLRHASAQNTNISIALTNHAFIFVLFTRIYTCYEFDFGINLNAVIIHLIRDLITTLSHHSNASMLPASVRWHGASPAA